MTTEDQKLTNRSVKPADDPRKYSINAAQIIVLHCFCWCPHHNTKMSFTKQGTR